MNILLFVVGAAIIYWLQMLFCKFTWNYKLNADACFSEKQAAEGDMVNLTITVENRKALPIITVKTNVEVDRGLEFQDQSNLAISDKNYRSEIFSMRGNERVQRDIPLFCAKRGYYYIDGIDFVGNDLFYTRRFLAHQKVSCNICVYPGKADARQLMVATQKMNGETVVRSSDCDDPFTFRGIRQYQSFDSIRDINWKASAKTGDLRVNIHDFTADQEIAILLDTEWDSLLRPDNLLEESIRIAASMADEFIGKGVMTSLYTNGHDCLTGEVFSIGGGANAQHSSAIQYGLARMQIPKQKKESTIIELMKEQINQMDAQPNRKVSWVFISTETNDGTAAVWKELSERAVKAYWIVPAHSSSEIPDEMLQNPEVMYWEVAYGK
ncbi:MAG: DUF58 domain-containing protein [Bariatricus sp.]